jgi:dihydroorotase
MSNFLAITNAQILGGGTSLLIEGDRIAGIDLPIPADASTLDAKGAIVAPGLVDLGVFSVDKRACIAGGITRVALMPDQTPVLDEPGIVQRAALAAKPDLWVHPLAAATKGLEGRELGEVAMMRKAGARAIATGRHWIADSGVMMKVMAYAASLNMTLISHAEDGGLAGNAVATSGEIASRLGLASAPAEAEAIAIARDCIFAKLQQRAGWIWFVPPKPRAYQSAVAFRQRICFCRKWPFMISAPLRG